MGPGEREEVEAATLGQNRVDDEEDKEAEGER